MRTFLLAASLSKIKYSCSFYYTSFCLLKEFCFLADDFAQQQISQS